MSDARGGTAIYLHLPFCPYVCPYCDFAKTAWDASSASAYLAALRTEIDAAPPVRATTLYLGGGTPTTYDAAGLVELVARVRARFALPDDAEVTVEANPDPPARGGLAALRAGGVSRLSIGVQSFAPPELRALGRRHDPDDVERFVAAARAAGFTNLSLDLMFGVPHQTEASWRETLARAIALGPEHISTYGLTVEAETPYERWFAREPAAFADDDLQARFYAIAIATLGEAGYRHYEISNHARPGYESAHNRTYWANDEYLGFGVGAASYRAGTRSVHTRDLRAYVTAARAGGPIPSESERLTGDARTGEAIMLALRTAEGVDVPRFRERYGIDVPSRFRDVIARYAELGLLHAQGDRIALTERGRFVANDVCGAFLPE